MNLLTYPDIFKKFQAYVKNAERIDLAVAWVTNSSVLELLRRQTYRRPSLKIRALVGIDTNFTHPVALQTLASFAEIRVVKNKQGIFHPKMYLFYFPKKMIVWVGSANFTDSGLNGNEELVSEFESSLEFSNEAKIWFDNRWKLIEKLDSDRLVNEYKTYWSPIKTDKLFKQNIKDTSVNFDKSEMNLECNWNKYLQQIESLDQYWSRYTENLDYPFSVLSDSESYITVISDGYAITRYKTWDKLSKCESIMLLGLNNKYGVHGLLGSMCGAGIVKNVFLEPNSDNLRIRRTILSAIQNTIKSDSKSEYIKYATEALEQITQYSGFGMGVATRLLALARPDMAISLNKASQRGLAGFSGLKLATSKKYILNYINLLEWMYNQPWYNSPPPTEPRERNIWDKRAALVDAFAYYINMQN